MQGGNLVATNLLAADFIEVLRNASVTGQLGAKWLTGLVGNVAIPRQTAQTSTDWVGESAAITESEGTFDQVTPSPKILGALSKISSARQCLCMHGMLWSYPRWKAIRRFSSTFASSASLRLTTIASPRATERTTVR